MSQKRKIMNKGRPMANGRHNAAFTLIELVVVIAIVVVLIGLLSVGLIGARQKAARRATQGRMAQLEVAIQRFYDEFRVYPPDEWGDRLNPLAATMMNFLVDQGYDTDDDGDLFPEITTMPDDTYQDIECLVYALTVVRPFFQLKKAERYNKEATPDKIKWQDAETMNSPAYEICDAWGNPLHYVVVADSGTVEEATPLSLTASLKSWDDDRWIDWVVSVGEQVRTITDNDSDTLTISPAWFPEPTDGSFYTISKLPLHNPGFVDIWSNGPDRENDSGADDDVTNWEKH